MLNNFYDQNEKYLIEEIEECFVKLNSSKLDKDSSSYEIQESNVTLRNLFIETEKMIERAIKLYPENYVFYDQMIKLIAGWNWYLSSDFYQNQYIRKGKEYAKKGTALKSSLCYWFLGWAESNKNKWFEYLYNSVNCPNPCLGSYKDLASCYINGDGIEKDLTKAQHYLETALNTFEDSETARMLKYVLNEQGINEDFEKLNSTIDKADKNKSLKESIQDKIDRSDWTDLARKLELLKQNAESFIDEDFHLASHWLYLCYRYGLGTESNPEMAWENAQHAGILDGYSDQGDCWLLGIGVSRNPVNAIECYKSAMNECSDDESKSYYEHKIANAYLYSYSNVGIFDINKFPNERKGIEFLKKAVEHKNAFSLFEYIKFLIYAKHIKQNLKEAEALTDRFLSSNPGNPDFEFLKASILIESHNDTQKGIEMFERLSQAGENLATMRLYLMYKEGLYVARSLGTALKYLKTASENGFIEAYFELGNVYYSGKLGIMDKDIALDFYLKRIECGSFSVNNGDYFNDKILGKANYMVATIYAEKGLYRNALSYYESALRLGYNCYKEITECNNKLHNSPDRCIMMEFNNHRNFSDPFEDFVDFAHLKFSILKSDSALRSAVDNYCSISKKEKWEAVRGDYSIVIFSLSKSFESVLKDRLIMPFKDYMMYHSDEASTRFEKAIVSDASNETRGVFARFELGNFKKIFYSNEQGLSNDEALVSSKMTMNFLNHIFLDDVFSKTNKTKEIILYMNHLVDVVNIINTKYRKDSVHNDRIFTKEDAEDLFDILILKEKIEVDIIKKTA